jgi:hypothetical protein
VPRHIASLAASLLSGRRERAKPLARSSDAAQ